MSERMNNILEGLRFDRTVLQVEADKLGPDPKDADCVDFAMLSQELNTRLERMALLINDVVLLVDQEEIPA